jgi:sRNA-binding carbon storage regulator CsrA
MARPRGRKKIARQIVRQDGTGFLYLNRRPGEKILIGDPSRYIVTVLRYSRGEGRSTLGFDVPLGTDITFDDGELFFCPIGIKDDMIDFLIDAPAEYREILRGAGDQFPIDRDGRVLATVLDFSRRDRRVRIAVAGPHKTEYVLDEEIVVAAICVNDWGLEVGVNAPRTVQVDREEKR